ncbi:hypothetical protein CDAR_376621 [Caerostris darwini]|uniref:Uncharacterized protein n=1 Tax=Caerostris darwini TaxID=1538125 RepID=A0AAV4R9A9_9ARAC|nr:hypothetical protein CDAR_376621 [Caerostris darwini]
MASAKPELAAGNRLLTFGKIKRLAAAAVAINSYMPNLSDIEHKLLDAFRPSLICSICLNASPSFSKYFLRSDEILLITKIYLSQQRLQMELRLLKGQNSQLKEEVVLPSEQETSS